MSQTITHTSVLKQSNKKLVSFSEALEHVRYFKKEEPVTSIWRDLCHFSSFTIWNSHEPHEVSQLTNQNQVLVDSLVLRGSVLEFKIYVKNLAFLKKVTVRYSYDGWQTFHDKDADFEMSDHAKNIDRFCWRMDLSARPHVPLVFAVKYECLGVTFWDNNGGKNYKLEKNTTL